MFGNNEKPLIMGILNVTPDSFSDGGKFVALESSLQHGARMIEEGADIIDIGGESTRPGSDPVRAEEQIKRIVPVITEFRRQLSIDIPISIDTTSSLVAEAALDAGATIINDVSAGRHDGRMLQLVARSGVSVILMHMQGKPKTMQDHPHYDDVIVEIRAALEERANAALAAGVHRNNIVIDPGIGFGKRKQDNLILLAHLGEIVTMGYPVLLGASRKQFMGSLCDVSHPSELVTATAVSTALGVMAGVQIFRVHDVRENRQAADLAWAIKRAGI